jgi:hypothetical protein
VGFSRFILLRHRICVVQKKLMFKLFALIEVFSSGGGMIELSCEDLTLSLFSPSSSSLCQICRWFSLALVGDSVPSVKSRSSCGCYHFTTSDVCIFCTDDII